MVEVVSPHTMPSESEVHVARSFLTKILRSSMRKNRFKGKNDPSLRPHSWHSSKLTEEESEPTRGEAAPAPVWQPKHEARPKESSFQGDQHNQPQIASKLSSVNNMEKVERPAHPYSTGHISPNQYASIAEPGVCGPGAKADSGFSCFSSGSSPPIHDAGTLGRKGTSVENIFFKGLQNEGAYLADRPRYLQPLLGNGGWEEQVPSRVSSLVRPSVGLVWQVPDKKSQSPPPPPPPLRSDSFAATKVFPYSEGPDAQARSLGRSVEKPAEGNNQNGVKPHQEKASEVRRSFNPPPAKDFLHLSSAADHNLNQLHSNKHFSLSSTDVRQSHYTHLPAHQRQYSDESPFYLQTKSAPPIKTQSVGSYYRSLQDLPLKAYNRKQVRHSTASVSSTVTNQNLDTGGHNRYHSLASKHSIQTLENQTRQSTAEGRRGEVEKPHYVNSSDQGFSASFKTNTKAKYSLPQCQMPYNENKERNGHSHLGNGLSESSAPSRSPENVGKRGDVQTNDTKRLFPNHQNNDHKVALSRQPDLWVPQDDHRISAFKTPLLHSLAQESRTLVERQPAAANSGSASTQDLSDTAASGGGKANRRSDRYATTLRNEIKEKRAQLQKSRSAATLTCDTEDE